MLTLSTYTSSSLFSCVILVVIACVQYTSSPLDVGCVSRYTDAKSAPRFASSFTLSFGTDVVSLRVSPHPGRRHTKNEFPTVICVSKESNGSLYFRAVHIRCSNVT